MRAIGVLIQGKGVTGGIFQGGQPQPTLVRERAYRINLHNQPALKDAVPQQPRVSAVLGLIEDLLKIDPEVSAIGVASPGVIDSHRGIVLDDPAPGYTGTDWLSELTRRFGRQYRYHVQNDAKAAAWAEYLFWHLRDAEQRSLNARRPTSLIHVIVDDGVGAGIVINGLLLLGAHFVAGEFGALPVGNSDQRRSIEAITAWNGLLKAMELKTIAQVVERSRTTPNDPAIREGAFALGVGLSALVNIIGPAVVTLGGAVVEDIQGYYEMATQHAQQLFSAPDQDVVFSRPALGQYAQIVGIAHLALQYGQEARDETGMDVQSASA